MNEPLLRPAVFLDRDGVINPMIFRQGKFRSPYTVEAFHFFPGVVEAAQALRDAGFLLVVATNQPDVSRGWLKREDVEAMNAKVQQELGITEVKACFHDAQHDCDCRKPKPGMLVEAAAKWGIDPQRSYMVGDRVIDIQAGQAAGCRTVLIGGEDIELCSAAPPDHVAESLLQASRWILGLRPAS